MIIIIYNNLRIFSDEVRKKQADLWNVCNQQQCNQHNQQKGQTDFIKIEDGFFKAETGNKQVQTYRRCQITDLKICQKDYSQVNRIDSVTDCNRHNQWNDDDNG